MFKAPQPRRVLAGICAAAVIAGLPFPAEAPAIANDAIDQLITGSIDGAPADASPRAGLSAGFRAALKLIDAKDYAGAYQAARGLSDDTERRAIQWAAIYYGNGDVPSGSVERFIKDAPGFAKSGVIKTRLEQALTKEDAGPDALIGALAGAMPNTFDAQIALAQAYVAKGETARAAKIARSIWVENFLDRATEDTVLTKLGNLLTRADHWDRAEHLMMNDRAAAVERLLGFMTPAQKTLALARNAVSRNDKNAKKLLDAVDPSMRDNVVYLFSRAQRARQFELWDDATAFLNKVGGKSIDADLVWNERRLLIRQLLGIGQVKKAYAAALSYKNGPEGRMVEAHFHAGWIALSFLKDAKAAVPQFEAMAKLSSLPDSVTQANFWLGRARAAAGDKKGAATAWQAAARFSTLYYGQLARSALGLKPVELREMPAWKPAEPVFEAREIVKAVRLLADGGEKELAVPLLRSLLPDLKDGPELLLAARLAQSLDAHHLAITIADTAERRGTPLDLFNFPKDGLPSAQLAEMDVAAIYAIARQESRFQVDAVSSAGARGLMQLMPATAKETAGKLGLSYSASKLTSDAAYNALLGSSYLKAQLQGFDNSLLLAAAAYNAGAGNAKKWMGTFGDPRTPSIDPVVWVELIPVQETRKYVQRVLGNYLVYRARLGHDELSPTEALRRIPG
jgi:soluble lytic murein transglycosylase